MSLRKAKSSSDSVSTIRRRRRANSRARVTKKRRAKLQMNSFTRSSSGLRWVDWVFPGREAFPLALPPSGLAWSEAVSSVPRSSWMLRGPLVWRTWAWSEWSLDTGVGSMLSEGLYESSENSAVPFPPSAPLPWDRNELLLETDRSGVEWPLSRRDSKPEIESGCLAWLYSHSKYNELPLQVFLTYCFAF